MSPDVYWISRLFLVLSGGYREAKISPLDEDFTLDHATSTEEYEYMSDSDLDDEEEMETVLPTKVEENMEAFGIAHETSDNHKVRL